MPHPEKVSVIFLTYLIPRAAAQSKLGEHSKAVDDCKKAVAIDPNYGKAYGRMGLVRHNI